MSSQEVCNDYERGRCFRATCRYSHPGAGPVETPDVCKDFLANKCTRGSRCRYSHAGGRDGPADHQRLGFGGGGGGSSYGGGGYGGSSFNPSPYSNPYMNNPYAAAYGAPPGRDPYGADPYARDPYAAFESPYAPSPYPPMPSRDVGRGREQKEKCRDFLSGKCSRDNCRFDHAIDTCGDFLRGRCDRNNCRYSHKKEQCRDFCYRGTCKFGDDCKYSHDEEHKQNAVPICRDFQKGACKYDKCKYRHELEEMGSKRTRDDDQDEQGEQGEGDKIEDSGEAVTGHPDDERPAKQSKHDEDNADN